MRKLSYQKQQEKIQIHFFEKEKIELNGTYTYTVKKTKEKKTISKPYLLKDALINIYNGTNSNADKVLTYFKENGINWWHGTGPTNNTLSSQIACLNHLFFIREDFDAVLQLAKNISSDVTKVFELENDKEGTRGYISFEVVSKHDHLNESKSKDKKKKLSRGSNCTSIDALILAECNNKKTLLVIEWKYVEHYSNEDKSKSKGGTTILSRYTDLISKSGYLENKDDGDRTKYFTEPFYQLMRQTMWAEQMIENEENETIKAEDYIHVHVVPDGNIQLLEKNYFSSNKGMIAVWESLLKHREKYVHITPMQLLDGVKLPGNLRTYLEQRYWQ